MVGDKGPGGGRTTMGCLVLRILSQPQFQSLLQFRLVSSIDPVTPGLEPLAFRRSIAVIHELLQFRIADNVMGFQGQVQARHEIVQGMTNQMNGSGDGHRVGRIVTKPSCCLGGGGCGRCWQFCLVTAMDKIVHGRYHIGLGRTRGTIARTMRLGQDKGMGNGRSGRGRFGKGTLGRPRKNRRRICIISDGSGPVPILGIIGSRPVSCDMFSIHHGKGCAGIGKGQEPGNLRILWCLVLVLSVLFRVVFLVVVVVVVVLGAVVLVGQERGGKRGGGSTNSIQRTGGQDPIVVWLWVLVVVSCG